MSSPDLTAFLYMSLDTPLLHVLCCHLLQPSHRRASWRLVTNCLHSMHRVSIFLHSLEIKYYITEDYNGQKPGRFDTQMKRQSKVAEKFITKSINWSVNYYIQSKYNYEYNTRIDLTCNSLSPPSWKDLEPMCNTADKRSRQKIQLENPTRNPTRNPNSVNRQPLLLLVWCWEAEFLLHPLYDWYSQYLCRARPRAVWYHILKTFKAFLASSFVRGVLRSTTASVYKLFIRRFSRIQVS